jgi:hypothetical protein
MNTLEYATSEKATSDTVTTERATFQLDLVTVYWAVTTVLIAAALSGVQYAYEAVVLLNIVQVIHFMLRENSVTAFPVEVRATYLVLLIVSQAPYMIWVLWWQLIGTAAMVMFRYCFLARLLSLMPWRKTEPYSTELIKKTFFTAPVKGNILQGQPARS